MKLYSGQSEPRFKNRNELIAIMVNEQIIENDDSVQYCYDCVKVDRTHTHEQRVDAIMQELGLSEHEAYDLATECMKFQYGEQFDVRPFVPTSVTARQGYIYMHREGLLEHIEAYINNLPEPVQTEARIEWEKTAVIERDNPLLAEIAEMMQWDDERLDEMFTEASKL